MTIGSFPRALALATLSAGLMFMCIAISTSPYVLFGAQIIGLFLIRGHLRGFELLARPAVAMPILSFGLLVLACAFTAKSLEDILPLFVYLPLIFVAPIIAVLTRIEDQIEPAIVGNMALIGAAGAMLIALYEIFVLHVERAGGITANPIHFSGIAALLGFIALAGFFSAPGRHRLWFLLGPIFAAGAVICSGSRGPLLAIIALAAMSLFTLAIWSRLGFKIWLAIIALTLAALAILLLGAAQGWSPAFKFLTVITDVFATGSSVDTSTSQRVIMYQGAMGAFAASPWIGFGMADFVAAAAAHGPVGFDFPVYDHLHNDIADFAVVGGIVGLIAYVVLLASPLVEAFRAPASRNRDAALLLALILSFGYLILGLTNAMFGILVQTIFFPFVSALIAVLARSTAGLPAIDLAPETLGKSTAPLAPAAQ